MSRRGNVSFQKHISQPWRLKNFCFVEKLKEEEWQWVQMLRWTVQNQRLFNENNASVHIIISWTRTTSLIIHQRHPGLNCTAATVEPSARCLWFTLPPLKYSFHLNIVVVAAAAAASASLHWESLQKITSHLANSLGISEIFFWSSQSKKLIIVLLFMVLDCLL